MSDKSASSTVVYADIAAVMRRATLEAGAAISEIYRGNFEAEEKADGSPITEADRRAHDIIRQRLRAGTPDIAIVSEEDEATHDKAVPPRFFLIDPLDGTKEFISRNGEFTVNVALIEAGVPVLGAVYAPDIRTLWWTPNRGEFVCEKDGEEHKARYGTIPGDGLTAFVSRSHLDQKTCNFLEENNIAKTIPFGSSIKFCLLAEGKAGIYPRFSRTMEWDTAAGDAVLRAAGGSVSDHNGNAFRYGKPGFENAEGFIARGVVEGGN